MHFQLISRAVALEIKSKFYFTGAPCKNGNAWVRRTSSRGCMCLECNFSRNAKTEQWRISNKDRKNETRRAWCSLNKERVSETNKRYRLKDIDRAREKSRESYWRNRDNCLASRSRYAEQNKEEIAKKAKEYRERNRDIVLQRMRDYYIKTRDFQRKKKSENKDHRRAWEADWRERNRGDYNASRAKRRADKKNRTPIWVGRDERKKIADVYRCCNTLSKLTGIQFHVDHIIPLVGKLVSGLHVSGNLQIIEAKQNISKGNSYVI